MASGSAMARLTQADRVYVGWRYAQVHPDPGPPPGLPETPERPSAGPPARRPAEHMTARPLRIATGGTVAGAALFLACGVAGMLPWAFAGVALLACAVVLGITGGALWRDEQAVRARMADERERGERERVARDREHDAARRAYDDARREWERRHRAYESQREWYPVAVPPGVDRVDVVGGTLAGWSAAVTTMGAARLAVGARLTVIDLSEGAVAHDLLRLAADRGDDPLVWVLPADLPRLDMSRGLSPEALADVLSLVVSAGEEEGGTRDLSFDNSILERLIEVLGPDATIPRITAALRVLAQVGDPREDLRKGLLTDEQLERVATLFGRDATDRIVVRRAWALEAQLRKLERLATEPVGLPPSRLHVVSMDRRAGVLTNRILGTYVTTALTHRIRESPPGGRWDHTLFLCGAEKLRGDVLDRLIDACEATGTGLVLMYRSIPRHVRERLGRRGHAAVGFMRLGNPEDARVAAEHIGTDQPLLVAEITDSAGETLFDVAGESYASTVAYARPRGDGLTDPVWSPLPAPAADDSVLVEGISSATAWGRTVTARPAAKQRFRELLVEPPQLQELPPTAMVFTHSGATGRRIMLVDANPGIITLPTAHSMEFEEYLREQEALEQAAGEEPGDRDGVPDGDAGGGSADAEPEEAPQSEPSAPPAAPRARYALPRGAAPRSRRIVPPLKRNGRHKADPPA
ncbi:coiled-coil domain-containing protein [Actinomadura napierensis]